MDYHRVEERGCVCITLFPWCPLQPDNFILRATEVGFDRVLPPIAFVSSEETYLWRVNVKNQMAVRRPALSITSHIRVNKTPSALLSPLQVHLWHGSFPLRPHWPVRLSKRRHPLPLLSQSIFRRNCSEIFFLHGRSSRRDAVRRQRDHSRTNSRVCRCDQSDLVTFTLLFFRVTAVRNVYHDVLDRITAAI